MAMDCRIARRLAAIVVGVSAWMDVASASKPDVPPAGFAVTAQVNNLVTYSDGYQTLGNLTYPTAPVPATGWPLVVLVHGLGGSRNVVDGSRFARYGYAVWAYDVRGQGDAAALNDPLTSTGWAWYGPNEKFDLAEQIEYVRAHFGSIVSPSLVAVSGPSQGGAHAWFAAAHSGRMLTVTGRGTIAFPVISAALPGLMVADVADTQVRDGTIMSYLMARTAAGPSAIVVKDPITEAQIVQYLLSDDGPGLAAAWAADPSRNWGHLLDDSTVPVSFFHPWHDGIGPPQPAYDRIATLNGPWRAHLSTGGHLTTFNDHEELFILDSDVRWLDHFLWNEDNGIDQEQPVTLAAMPPDAQEIIDPAYAWGHRSDTQLDPVDAVPWRLYCDGTTLGEAEPLIQATQLSIDHQVGVAFTPAAWLADPLSQDLNGLLTHMPLSELVFASAPLAVQTELGGQAHAHLAVTPQTARFQITALLSVLLPGATSDFMLAAWGREVRDATPGVATAIDIKIGGVSTVLPAGSVIKLSLRNLWIVEAPMNRDIQGWPSFTPFQVDVNAGAGPLASYVELPRRGVVRATLNPAIQPMSLANVGTVNIELRGGAARAGAGYLVLMGASGQTPGLAVTGGVVPIHWDAITSLGAAFLGFPLFQDFLGTLDANGDAVVNLPLGGVAIPPEVAGKRITFAAWIMGPTATTTNASELLFVP